MNANKDHFLYMCVYMFAILYIYAFIHTILDESYKQMNINHEGNLEAILLRKL